MDCKSLQAILAGERADDLSTAESEAFDRHLDACAPCRDGLARAEDELDALATRLEPPTVAPEAWDKVTRAVKAQAARPILTVHAGGGAARALAIAAAVLLAVGIGLLLPLDLFRDPANGSPGLSGLGTEAINPPAPPVAEQPAPSLPPARVELVGALEYDEDQFDADAQQFLYGDEQLLVVWVRDKSL